MQQAIGAPRIHTEGGLKLTLDDPWTKEDVSHFNQLGYEVNNGQVAYLSAVSSDPRHGRVQAAHR